MASPLEIMIGLHYWTRSSVDYSADDRQHATSPAVRQALIDMHNAKLLQTTSTGSVHFERGEALECWIKALLNIPWPIQKWVIPVE